MNYLDIYYRALIDYRKNTTENRDCINQRTSTAKANAKDDKLTIIRKICTVNTDWVEAIEEGLVHVEKAIREERQFIRSNGEVIDIEKVKNVSKDSVEHLSRHSNLITRYEEGEDVVPDRLYTVERLSDYAVYENRFLYMLLCYLRDFITVRYNKILDLEHTYNGSMTMNKSIVMTKRNLSFEVTLKEERKDDIYLKKQSESRDIIVRIGNLLKLVLAFLATPLMQEVSKVAMLKPPITKTNVLRMNHNFRGALALYEFISAYDKAGYEVEERVQEHSPFRVDVADEFAEIVMLASFLTYEHGLNLKGELQIEYEKEQDRRREEEKARYFEQLKALKHRIRESEEGPYEYMLVLEKLNRMLREDSDRLVVAKQEIEDLKGEIANLQNEKKSLIGNIEKLTKDIEDLTRENENKIAQLESEHIQDKERICTEYEGKIDEINKGVEDRVNVYRDKLSQQEKAHSEEIRDMQNESTRIQDELNSSWQRRTGELNTVIEEKNGEIGNLTSQIEKLLEDYRLSQARLTALRHEKGLVTDTEDLTSEQAFEELEKQLELFMEFFKKQWGITKKAIRKNAIKEFFDSIKAEKENKKQAKAEGKRGKDTKKNTKDKKALEKEPEKESFLEEKPEKENLPKEEPEREGFLEEGSLNNNEAEAQINSDTTPKE